MEKLFSKQKYADRRRVLMSKISGGIIFLPGNHRSPMNYKSNVYRFRQDSNFLYFFGLDSEGLAGIIDVDSGEEIIFGPVFTMDDLIWTGPLEKIEDRAEKAGIKKTLPTGNLKDYLQKASHEKRKVHYLPPYRGERTIWLSELLDKTVSEIENGFSQDLISAVCSLRIVKDDDEIQEIESTLENITRLQHIMAMKNCRRGIKESYIVGIVEGFGFQYDCMLAFPVICSVHGEILHNESHDNTLKDGQLMILDTGNESPMHYATDITRTTPVSGKFTRMQAEIYNLVLEMMNSAFKLMKPGISYSDVHKKASETLAKGLTDIGLMQGNPEEIVASGAHALFFPHGLGHQMGLDVHDMEDLGEDNIGYDNEHKRSTQFGTAFLRFGRKLEKGMILTVEPGIYFIPALIDLWKSEKKYESFINYSALNNYMNFGGIRIEDDVLITDTGNRILGKPIPKTIAEVEETFKR
ncbi:MAG: aminopeptidase P family protein [Bacteroidales bacterium]|nr:MAG: aminopeptidase P family protein [Bacteroidales bacterium]